MNDATCVSIPPSDKIIAIAAPNPAPLLTPNRSGDTSGFLNSPWKDAPAMASDAPTISAASILGSLTWNTMLVIVGDTVSVGISGESIVFITSIGLIGYLPTMNDAKNRSMGRNINSM